ncbi:hypothetical protein J4217_02175 [Candidatus Pacearchaeota archaeon]|nr:hypothetical protein [Candidatus Pacearchaeota archaeon]
MIEIKTKLRRWGNSFGVVVPMGAVEKERMNEGDEIKITIGHNKSNILRETFGIHKFKKPISQLMEEIDKELYDV